MLSGITRVRGHLKWLRPDCRGRGRVPCGVSWTARADGRRPTNERPRARHRCHARNDWCSDPPPHQQRTTRRRRRRPRRLSPDNFAHSIYNNMKFYYQSRRCSRHEDMLCVQYDDDVHIVYRYSGDESAEFLGSRKSNRPQPSITVDDTIILGDSPESHVSIFRHVLWWPKSYPDLQCDMMNGYHLQLTMATISTRYRCVMPDDDFCAIYILLYILQ